MRTLKRLLPDPARQHLKVLRARLFEMFGSHRYSAPGLSGLDVKVRGVLPAGPGVFLEIGANNGYAQSNTYYLERVLGWRGILIEPIPRLAAACRRLRKASDVFQFACVGADGPKSIEILDLGLESIALSLQDSRGEARAKSARTGRSVVVSTKRISEIIEMSGQDHIDFMSIDVEGSEMQVLSGLDLRRHVPRVMLVETAEPDRVTKYLSGYMTLHAKLTHHDYLYVAPIAEGESPASRAS